MTVFGLDGGGTTTRLRIADGNNTLIWEGRGPGINPNACRPAESSARIRSLFAKAFVETTLSPGQFKAGCAGVAGADRPEEKAWLESVFRDKIGFTCPILFTADPDIALAGALESPEGIILIAGTGSVALARTRSQGRFRAGGYGHFLGDEGSAFWIAFQGIARSIRSSEGRDLDTKMLKPLADHFGIEEPAGFIRLVYREFDKARIAGAAGIVAQARDEGDKLALDIYKEASSELVELVRSVWTQAGDRLSARRLALRGGVFDNDQWLVHEVRQSLAAGIPELQIVEAAQAADFGACILALELAQIRR